MTITPSAQKYATIVEAIEDDTLTEATLNLTLSDVDALKVRDALIFYAINEHEAASDALNNIDGDNVSRAFDRIKDHADDVEDAYHLATQVLTEFLIPIADGTSTLTDIAKSNIIAVACAFHFWAKNARSVGACLEMVNRIEPVEGSGHRLVAILNSLMLAQISDEGGITILDEQENEIAVVPTVEAAELLQAIIDAARGGVEQEAGE